MRIILAIAVSIVVGNVVFFLTSVVAGYLYPTPPELMNPQTPEATAMRVASANANGLLLVLLGAALGGFSGGATGAAIAREKAIWAAVSTGALLSLWAFYSFYVFYPARLWFPFGMGIAFLFLPSLGAYVASKMRSRPQDNSAAPPAPTNS